MINAHAMVVFLKKKTLAFALIKSYLFADIDECTLKLDECAKNEVCVNGEGFYYCEDPNNPDGYTDDITKKCPEGYTFNGENMVCDGVFSVINFSKLIQFYFVVDINECDIEVSCPRPKVCVNTIGSFTCEGEDIPQCPPGFHYKPATGTCEGKLLFYHHLFLLYNVILNRHR